MSKHEIKVKLLINMINVNNDLFKVTLMNFRDRENLESVNGIQMIPTL